MNKEQILTVSQINEYIKAVFDTDSVLSGITVKGEISNFTNHYKTGHFYFTLKDDGGVLRAVMFQSYTKKLPFLPENGMKVLAHGRISVFPRDGSYQLYADQLEPDGIGSLYLAYEQLKEKLNRMGMFSDAYKKPIPKYPKKIGVVTSPTGAAVRDMINISRRRFPLTKIVLFPCLVQGEGAPAQIASGINFFNSRMPVDLIIIGRGGGSLEELWAFNNEELAHVIFRSRVPIISAVGHETDFSISDFVSDLRAPTPSAAMELALPAREEIRSYLDGMNARLAMALRGQLSSSRNKIEQLAKKRCMTSPLAPIDDRRMRVLHLYEKLESRILSTLQNKKMRFASSVSKIDALNPLSVMARGYSAVYKDDGRLVNSVRQLVPGESVSFRIADGRAKATVTETWKEQPAERIEGNE